MILTVISPAKKLDYSNLSDSIPFTIPEYLNHSQDLIDKLKLLSEQDICKLMSLSEKLGTLNYERFQNFNTPFTQKNAKQAIYAFKGDVYQGLDVDSMSITDINWAQENLRIISGLYGLLRPLDLMQAYRLEMGTKFANNRGADLYAFWDGVINKEINNILKNPNDILVNLASNEYFRAVNEKTIKSRIITPVFMDYKNGDYKIISFFAKKARGMMAAFIIKNKISNIEDMKNFDDNGYNFNASMSADSKLVFTRKQ